MLSPFEACLISTKNSVCAGKAKTKIFERLGLISIDEVK